MQKAIHFVLIALGMCFVALGTIGAFLPGLPTVPFLIVALACFAKSSDRFHNWLYHHRIFGQQLQLWQRHRVIPPVAKIAAVGSMVLSCIYMIFFSAVSLFVIIPTIIVMIAGGSYILTKPSYPPR